MKHKIRMVVAVIGTIFAIMLLAYWIMVGMTGVVKKQHEHMAESNHAEYEADAQNSVASGGAQDKADKEKQAEDSDKEKQVTSSKTEIGQYEFNPHIHPKTLDTVVAPEYLEGMYNLIDALRAGEDSFECANEDVYQWCHNGCNVIQFLPAATGVLLEYFNLPEDAYKDGVGKIYYVMDKDKFLKREEAFEKDIMKVVNDTVTPEYSDFEKSVAFLDHIASTCDFVDIDLSGEEHYCRPLYEHCGVCSEFAQYYSYLLSQCGVDSLVVDNDDPEGGMHAWSYVSIDNKGFYVDPTWMLKSVYGDSKLRLEHFMVTDEHRANYDLHPEEFSYVIAPGMGPVCNDDRFEPLHEGFLESIDRDKNILYYSVQDEIKEFDYGDM